MPQLDRRLIAVAAASAALLVLIGFGIGRLTAGESNGSDTAAGPEAASTTTAASDAAAATAPSDPASETSSSEATNTTHPPIDGDPSAVLIPPLDPPAGGIPMYGSDKDREAFLVGLSREGVNGTDDDLLAVADHVCYTLERLQAQERTAAYAVRVVWNESLAELDSQDLAAFGVVFIGAPNFLCPESIFYGADVAYWLGF